MHKILFLILAMMVIFPAGNATAAIPAVAAQNAAKPASDSRPVDFAVSDPAIQLGPALSHYHAPGGGGIDGSHWYLMTAVNRSTHPVTRILLAEEPADAALHFFPLTTRARIMQIASSDGGVTIERQHAYGRHALRVTVPPATTAALAVRLSNADESPSVLAWSEPALVAYSRQFAVFIAAVAGLIAAAVAITGGLAAMTGHAAPRWAALTLLAIFIVWLATIGLFDSGWSTAVGGPYGFAAMTAGLALTSAARLTEEIAPLTDLWPWAAKYRRLGFAALLGLSGLAFIGMPGATVLMNIAVVFGAAGLAVYLVRRGITGSRPARVVAPSAAVFALVTLAAAMVAMGGFQDNPIASEIVGGFAAAGSVLLALAISAGEGTAVLPLGKGKPAAAISPQAQPAAAPRPLHDERRKESVPAALAAIGASHQGVFDLDFRADILRLSSEAATLIGFGRESQAIAHSSWLGRVHIEDRAVYEKALRDYRNRSGLAFRIEFRARSENGHYPWLELRATMIGEGNMADRCLGLVADVTTRKESEAAALDRTMFDPLTGLGNRVALMGKLDRLGRELGDVAFAILDIDRFKAIHASLGDAGGDAVLKHVAVRLTRRFEGKAQVFRVGGDAFALLFIEGGGSAGTLATELLDICNSPLFENGRKIFAPASIGLTTGCQTDEPLDLLRNAELALRQAKRQGGGCARIYSPELDDSAPADAVALEADLRHALDVGQIDVFYQPIMRLPDCRVAGFEALLRWHHPERGLIWPSDFVAHSEKTGLIVKLGKFVLMRAAEDLAQWQRYFPGNPALFVSVNVSRRQLLDNGFESFLAALLDKSTVASGSLRLEITESAVASGGHAEEKMARIRALGASFAIDDFGTGLSSLSQLRSFPFDCLKVDKSFLIRDNSARGDDNVILNSIVGLARELKCGLVVEGVESEDDVARLKALGCEFAQGFHFSVPLTAREALNFIALNYDTKTTVEKKLSESRSDGEPPSGASGNSG